MASNSAQMSLEERVVQQLKEGALGALIDEDSLTELCRRAIQEALYKDRPNPEKAYNYHAKDTIPSPAVSAASEIALGAARDVVSDMTKTLIKDEKFKKLVHDAYADAIFEALQRNARSAIDETLFRSKTDTISAIRGLISNHQL